jgi:hypothetical protein
MPIQGILCHHHVRLRLGTHGFRAGRSFVSGKHPSPPGSHGSRAAVAVHRLGAPWSSVRRVVARKGSVWIRQVRGDQGNERACSDTQGCSDGHSIHTGGGGRVNVLNYCLCLFSFFYVFIVWKGWGTQEYNGRGPPPRKMLKDVLVCGHL